MRGSRRALDPWCNLRLLVLVLVLVLVSVAGASRTAAAQVTSLTLSPSALTFATPLIADYTAGYVCAGSIRMTLTADNQAKRYDTVFVRLTTTAAMPSTVAGVTKALADFQFTTNIAGCSAPTASWAAVPTQTSAPALVLMGVKYKNTTVTGTVYFRLVLSWATDRGGATYTLPNVRFFLNRNQTIPAAP